jgi:hypothetical protein
MHESTRVIVGTTLICAALIGSSWGLKGHPAGDWVDAAIYIAMGCFFWSLVAPAVTQRSIRTPRTSNR